MDCFYLVSTDYSVKFLFHKFRNEVLGSHEKFLLPFLQPQFRNGNHNLRYQGNAPFQRGMSQRKGLFHVKEMTQGFLHLPFCGDGEEGILSHWYQVTTPSLPVRHAQQLAAVPFTDTEFAQKSWSSQIRCFRSFLKWILWAFSVSGYLVLLCQMFSFVSVWGFVCLFKLWENTGLFEYLIHLFKLLTIRIYFYKTIH